MKPDLMGDADRGVDIRGLLNVLARRKAAVVGPMVAAGLFALLVAANRPHHFTADAALVAEARQAQALSFGNGGNAPLESVALRTELDIISSPIIADRVAERLRAERDVGRSFSHPPAPTPLQAAVAATLPAWLAERLPHWLGGTAPTTLIPAPVALPDGRELANAVHIFNDGRSLTVHIRYTSRSPELSAAVVNGFADEYLRYQVESRTEAAQKATRWLADRLEDLRQDLERSELALERFRASQGLLGGDGGRPRDAELGFLRDELTAVQSSRIELETKLATLNAALEAGADLGSYAEGLGSPLLTELRQRESEATYRLSALLNNATPRHPEVQPLIAAVEQYRSQIRSEIERIIGRLEADRAALVRRASVLGATIDRALGQSRRESATMVRLQQLERDSNANRAIYETFLGRYKEMIEQAQVEEPQARVISYAVPPAQPDSGRALPTIIIGLFGGSLAGLGLAFLRDHFAKPIAGPVEAERLLGLPVFGLLPNVRTGRRRQAEDAVADDPHSSYGESLRAVYMALRNEAAAASPAAAGTRQALTVMVTSAVPDEGKSSFCFSLARVLARDGLKVLLVDADLRASRLGRRISDRHKADLLDILKGRATVEQALCIDRPSGAHYLGSRHACANPQAVLGGGAFLRMVAGARSAYDLIIVDTPPVSAVTDAVLVAPSCDIRLFVVRSNRTSRDIILSALRTLSLCRVRIDGLVISRVAGLRQYRWSPGRYYGGPRLLLEPPRSGGEEAA